MKQFTFKNTLTALALTVCLFIPSRIGHAAPKEFVHPGLLHTEADFDRMRAGVAANEHPTIDGWNIFLASPRSQLNWRPRPTANVIRGAVPGNNVAQFYPDVHAAYQLAVRWKVSGDEVYAKKSVEILNAWSSVLKSVNGNSDRFLAAGIYGYEFANAAEIMRTYPGWSSEDLKRFQTMMLEVFYPMNHDFLTNHNTAAITNYWANWDLCNLAAMLSIGVLCDRRDIYDEAVDYFYHGKGNGAMDKAVYYLHPGNLGQWQESGRDQGHNTLGIALMGAVCEAAWNQGDDLYGYDNNRFLAGAEYVAKYNLGSDVPYQSYSWGTGQRGNAQTQPGISPATRGASRPMWEMIVNHYVNRKGIAAPYSEQFAAKLRPEGGAGGHPSSFDQLGFGTLTFTRPPQIAAPRPSGLVARKSGGKVVLSWWGARGAQSYIVKRATKAGGPYTPIASKISDTFSYTDEKMSPGHAFYVVTGIASSGQETPPSNEVASSSTPELVTRLSFDDAQGEKALDASNHNNDGELQEGALFAAGHQGQALSLDGVNDYASLPEGVAANLGDFSVSAWVYLNSEQRWARLFDFGDDRGRYFFLSPRAGNGKIRFATSTLYGYNEQVVDSSTTFPIRQWVHVAFTLSGRVGMIYLNGLAVGSNPDLDFPPFQIGITPRNWIGRSQFPNDPHLNGKVDDFRLYDGALSAEQMAALAGGKDSR